MSRLYALVLLFSQQLPLFRPKFISKEIWSVLERLSLQKKLVELVCIKDGHIHVRLPIWFDILIHSRCVYGSKFENYNIMSKSRIKWWSEFKKRIRPILPALDIDVTTSEKIELTHITHIMRIPEFILTHPYFEDLYFDKKNYHIILDELSVYLSMLMQEYTSKDCVSNVKQVMTTVWSFRKMYEIKQ